MTGDTTRKLPGDDHRVGDQPLVHIGLKLERGRERVGDMARVLAKGVVGRVTPPFQPLGKFFRMIPVDPVSVVEEMHCMTGGHVPGAIGEMREGSQPTTKEVGEGTTPYNMPPPPFTPAGGKETGKWEQPSK